MKKIFLSIAVCSVALASCGEAKGEDESKAKDDKKTEEVIPEEVKPEEPVVSTLDNLPEGWKAADILATNYLYVHDSVTQEGMASLSDHYALGFGAVYGHIMEKGLDMAGAPMVVWKSWDTTAYSHLHIAMPTMQADAGSEIIKAGTLEAGPGLKYIHLGDYHNMIEPHMNINEWAAGANVTLGGPWEVYSTDPGMEPDTSKWQTEIWYPIILN